MGEKLIIRSSTADKHGDFIPLEQMKSYVETVNGEQKLRYLANHRRDLPPLGFLDNAEIQQKENVYHTLVEPIVFANRTEVDWDENLLCEDSGQTVTFIKRDFDDLKKLRVTMDKNNFSSFDSYQQTGKRIAGVFGDEVELKGSMRKNYLPDPQIVFTLAGYYAVLYPLIKPFLKKMGEKLAENITDDVYELAKSTSKKMFSKIADTVRIARTNLIPQNKALLTIFEIPGETDIELQVKSNDPNHIIKAISEKQLFKMHQKVHELQSKVGISEICFVFNLKCKWDFMYLITKDGKVIGSKVAFKKRDRLMERINLSPTKALSVGANGVEYVKIPKD